jgi:citrate lyase subunit beta/citryl-CoA lyase
VFGPDAAAVEHAHEVIRAYEAAVEEGQGVATLGGKLIENLHAAEAKRLVAYAARIAELSTS